jgi:hypothetical protein
MKAETPAGETVTVPCQVDDVTSLIYASFLPTDVGVYRCQIVFNAYPVQSKRCHVKVKKGHAGSTLIGKRR